MITYPVPAKGIGRPDNTPQVAVSRPVMDVNQEKWEAIITKTAAEGDAIPANSCLSIAVYTVPAGHELHIGGAVVTTNASCIQRMCMTYPPGILGGMFRYDVRGELILSSLSSTIVNAGETLNLYIYNDDREPRDFSVTIVGVLQKVG